MNYLLACGKFFALQQIGILEKLNVVIVSKTFNMNLFKVFKMFNRVDGKRRRTQF